MTEMDMKTIKELVDMKSKDLEKYTKYMEDWKAIQNDLNDLSVDKEANKPIKGRHILFGSDGYKKEYLESIIKEWQDRGIIV
jgi:hypothetical protein